MHGIDQYIIDISLGNIFRSPSDLSKQYGFHRILGSTIELYGAMMRKIILGLWKLKDSNVNYKSNATVTLDAEVTNRSSIVTSFERPRHDSVAARNAQFSMLFTGDAFDKACDIRDTLAQWKVGSEMMGAAQPINIDVLKVSDHLTSLTESFHATPYAINLDIHCHSNPYPRKSPASDTYKSTRPATNLRATS